MNPPSFQYAGIDADLLQLDAELQSLGGGDARTTSMELQVIVHERDHDHDKNQRQTIFSYKDSIGIRDITLPKDYPISESMKYIPVTNSTTLKPEESFITTELANDLVETTTDWLFSGFNQTIMSFGLQKTGKTNTIFGDLGNNIKSSSNKSCLSVALLRSLFHYISKHAKEKIIRVGISAWCMDETKVIDLMTPVASSKTPLDFMNVECPEINTAIQLLHEARARAKGCLINNSPNNIKEQEKVHFFFRVVLHQSDSVADTGMLSCLYLVDLQGFGSVSSNYYRSLAEADKICVRNRNLQLSTLLQVLQEMSSISRSALGLSAPDKLGPSLSIVPGSKSSATKLTTSARSSKLTTVLAPLIQGNMKTVVLAFLQDGEDVAVETRQLITQMSSIVDVKSACFKCKVRLLA